MAGWQNRIIGHGVRPASSFLANDRNWRIHPRIQQEVLKGVLSDLGWVDDVTVNLRNDAAWPESERGVETIVDGHLRVILALREGDDTLVPVKYIDVSEDEERLILATLDPMSVMAITDKEKLDQLLEGIVTENQAISAMLEDLSRGTLQSGTYCPGIGNKAIGDKMCLYIDFYGEAEKWQKIQEAIKPHLTGNSGYHIDADWFYDLLLSDGR
jgi:hypothetical protein